LRNFLQQPCRISHCYTAGRNASIHDCGRSNRCPGPNVSHDDGRSSDPTIRADIYRLEILLACAKKLSMGISRVLIFATKHLNVTGYLCSFSDPAGSDDRVGSDIDPSPNMRIALGKKTSE
jgi:hypothetical protein